MAKIKAVYKIIVEGESNDFLPTDETEQNKFMTNNLSDAMAARLNKSFFTEDVVASVVPVNVEIE